MLQNRVSYGYYFNHYSMSQSPMLSEENFSVYERRARAYLKNICISEVPYENSEDVFACVCALAEEMYSQKVRGGIKSENIDGYSVTFGDKDCTQKNLLDIARLYLGHLGLLYAGVE